MKTFHVTLHARPGEVRPGPQIEVDGRALATLRTPQGLSDVPLAINFEQAAERLDSLPGMYLEPDGSFVWRANHQPAWQLDGILYDRNDRLLYVELKGSCPRDAFLRVRDAIGAPPEGLVIQLLRQAIFLAEFEFERFVFR